MIKREYHCLVAGLPALFFDTARLAAKLVEWKGQLKEDLHPSDYTLMESYFLRYDNRNIHQLLTGKPGEWDPLGNYSKEQVEEVIDLLKDEDTDPESLDFPLYLFAVEPLSLFSRFIIFSPEIEYRNSEKNNS